jgi:hypothetical protein
MFDFVSPFDALASTSTVKKKPIPQPVSTSSGNEDAWIDPKRRSVENLIDQLTRGQAHNPSSMQTSSMQDPQLSYDPYMTGEDIAEPAQSRVPPPPLPPKPNRTASPRSSPPKVNATHRPQPQQTRLADSPISGAGVPTSQVPMGSLRKDKENPLLSRGSFKAKGGPGKSKNQSSPRSVHILKCTRCSFNDQFIYSPQAQSIVFDVSQPLDEVQAPRDAVKSTAIALVRQESVFLPGTTIGATHWVAYAMTRGLFCCFHKFYRPFG